MSEWDEVGGDPCPGDLAVITESRDFVRRVVLNGEELRDQYRGLMAGVDQLRWTGTAADATRAKGQEVLPQFFEFWSAHRDVETALTVYLDEFYDHASRARKELEVYQHAVASRNAAKDAEDQANSRARTATAELRRLALLLKSIQLQRNVAVLAGDPVAGHDAQIRRNLADQAAQVRLRNEAQQQASDASRQRGEHEGTRQRARAVISLIREEHDQAQRRTAQLIFQAVGIDDRDGSLAALVLRAGRGVASVVIDDAWGILNLNFAEGFLDNLHIVGDVCSLLSLGCLALSLIPGLGVVTLPAAAILGTAATIFTGIELAGRLMLYANGRGDKQTLLWLTLSLATFGYGKWFTALGKGKKVLGVLPNLKRLVRYERPNNLGGPLGRSPLRLGDRVFKVKSAHRIDSIPKRLRPWVLGAPIVLSTMRVAHDGAEAQQAVSEAVKDPSPANITNASWKLLILADDFVPGQVRPEMPKSRPISEVFGGSK